MPESLIVGNYSLCLLFYSGFWLNITDIFGFYRLVLPGNGLFGAVDGS